MQPANFCTTQVGPRRIVRVRQHDNAGTFRDPFQNGVYIRGEVFVVRRNGIRIVSIGVIRDLGVTMQSVDEFVARSEVGPCKTCEQII